jgi:hypothetical protein
MPPPPDGTNMPAKKDPRMRRLEQNTAPKIFDSADYEVQKQRAKDEEAKIALKQAAENAPHLNGQAKQP